MHVKYYLVEHFIWKKKNIVCKMKQANLTRFPQPKWIWSWAGAIL